MTMFGTMVGCWVLVVGMAGLSGSGMAQEKGASTRQAGTQGDIPRSGAPTEPAIPLQFNQNFKGNWAGALESRDYGSKTADAPHVKLATTLTMTPSPDGRAVNFLYTYDDGPVAKPGGRKIVKERTILAFTGNTALLTGTTTAENQEFQVAGVEEFAKAGLGTLVLTGPGKENDKAADFRITLTLSAGEFTWVKETRAAGSGDGFVFRDGYRMMRQ